MEENCIGAEIGPIYLICEYGRIYGKSSEIKTEGVRKMRSKSVPNKDDDYEILDDFPDINLPKYETPTREFPGNYESLKKITDIFKKFNRENSESKANVFLEELKKLTRR